MAALICALPDGAAAHDIPNDVRVQAFVKPSGQRLQLLVRVPLATMREVDFPRRGPGYLDLARADALLRNAATLCWLMAALILAGLVWLVNESLRHRVQRRPHPPCECQLSPQKALTAKDAKDAKENEGKRSTTQLRRSGDS